MEYIQLKKDDILRVGIKDANGKDTGEHLEFDLEDIELPLRIEEAMEKHKKNMAELRKRKFILDKNKDNKRNDMETLKLMKEFFTEEEKTLDLFLGKGGTKKMLNGRKYYYTMFDDIIDMLEPIFPLIEERAGKIADKIKNKYGSNEEEEVLE